MFQRLSVCAAAILLSCGVANASPIKLKAGPTQQVLVASDADPGQEIDAVCNTYGNITGASLNITIPAGQSSLLVARFSGIVTVGGQSNSGSTRAYVRIVVGTHELNPVEPLWSHLKRSLANLAKRNLAQLTAQVKTRLKRMQYRPALLEGAGVLVRRRFWWAD